MGRRLGLAALKVAYGIDSAHLSSFFTSMQGSGDSILIHVSAPVFTKDKYGYIRNFQIAGSDSVFHYAQAYLRNSVIVVFNTAVSHPVAVRYAWANNPGELDLYNKVGLPLLPFRTDTWRGVTAGKRFSYVE